MDRRFASMATGCGIQEFDVVNQKQELVTQAWEFWDRMIRSHVRITGERWIHSSPDYGCVVYKLPDWDLTATRSVKRITQWLGAETKVNCEWEGQVWLIEMPDLLLELRYPVRYMQLTPHDPYDVGRWIWLDGTDRSSSLCQSDWVGDVDAWLGMISYYQLTYDWNEP
jgi:hypothetical protein